VSNAVFPLLPGINIEQTLRPNWRTKVQRSVSGVRQTVAYMASPLWDITLDYNVLRQGFGETELDQLIGFFNARHGRSDDFLLDHPDYNSVVDKQFGVGDGTRTQWQLLREIGGFNEPVRAPKAGVQIFKDTGGGPVLEPGATVSSTGLVTFGTAPASSAVLTWTGGYYWRVAFKQDALDLKKFLQGLWEAGKVELESVK
jgi:uncharacterized protein (TIGR02217 family)